MRFRVHGHGLVVVGVFIVSCHSPGRHEQQHASWRSALEDPTITAEIDIDQAAPPADTYRRFSATASDGTDHLVVWNEYNTNSLEQTFYGARVKGDGTLVDTSGIQISSTVVNSGVMAAFHTPAVAWDGTNYLVVWADARDKASNGYDVYGARVTPAGAVLDDPNIAISTHAADQMQVSVASNGSGFLAVWWDARDGETDIYAARVAADGSVLDTDGIAVSTASGSQHGAFAVSDGTDYLVVWHDSRNTTTSWDIYGARVKADGTVLDPDGRAICTANGGQFTPAAAFDGASYFVVWEDDRSLSSTAEDIFGARVAVDGTVLDPSGILIAAEPDTQFNPRITFDGSRYLAVWEDWRNPTIDIYGSWISSAGDVLNSSGVGISVDAKEEELPVVSSSNAGVSLVTYGVGADWNNSRIKARLASYCSACQIADGGTDSAAPSDGGSDLAPDSAPADSATADSSTADSSTADSAAASDSASDTSGPVSGDDVAADTDDGGCSCQLDNRSAGGWRLLLIGMILLLAAARRRSRRRRL